MVTAVAVAVVDTRVVVYYIVWEAVVVPFTDPLLSFPSLLLILPLLQKMYLSSIFIM